MSAEREQRGENVSGVAIVIDDQNPERRDCCRLVVVAWAVGLSVSRRDRQLYDELTSQTDPGLLTSTMPPCISVSVFTSDSPIPSPVTDRSNEVSTCANKVKTRPIWSAAIPMPVSRTRIATSGPTPIGVSAGRSAGEDSRLAEGLVVRWHANYGGRHLLTCDEVFSDSWGHESRSQKPENEVYSYRFR